MGVNDQYSQPMARPNFQAQKSGGVAYCPGYTDADGNWNTGFPCKRWGGPDENYCCGDDKRKFCCPERPPNQPAHAEPAEPPVRGASDSRTTLKSRSQSRSDAPDWPLNSDDSQGQVVTPPFVPEQRGAENFFQSVGRISGNVNFPLFPAVLAFTATAAVLACLLLVVCCCFCPSCPAARSRRKRRETKTSKFIKTTSVNLEAEETAAAIAAQALVSVTAGGTAGFDADDLGTGGDLLGRGYSNYCVVAAKGHAQIGSGPPSTNSSLPRGCVDFGCRCRQDSASDQLSTAASGCFHGGRASAPSRGAGGGHQGLKPFQHVTEQMVDSSSLQGLVVGCHFARNSPTTTSTSNSSDQTHGTGQGQPQPHHPHHHPHPHPTHHNFHHHQHHGQCACAEGRPQVTSGHLMDVDSLVSALYQNNNPQQQQQQQQPVGSDLGWKSDMESSLIGMASLNKELNGNIYTTFPPESPNGMDDNSIKKWLSSTASHDHNNHQQLSQHHQHHQQQQPTPNRSLFGVPLKTYHPHHHHHHHHADGIGDASQQLLPDRAFVPDQPAYPTKGTCGQPGGGRYPDVTQTCMTEKQPFLGVDGSREFDARSIDVSAQFGSLKPDLTSSTYQEPGLSAVDIPNCPQLKLTSGEWLPKLRYETNFGPAH